MWWVLLTLCVSGCHGEMTEVDPGEAATESTEDSEETSAEEIKEALREANLESFDGLDTYSRLTKQEYRYVISDLLVGVDDITRQRVLQRVETFNENNNAGFYKNYEPHATYPGLEITQLELASALADAFTTSDWFLQLCANDCASNLTSEFVPRVWKRRVSDDEARELREFYGSLPAENRDLLFLTRVFASPYFHHKIFSATFDDPSDRTVQRAHILSHLITGSFPDDELHAASRDGSLEEKWEEHIARLLDKHPDRFATLFVPQWLGFSSLRESLSTYYDVPLKTVMTEPALIFAELLKADAPIASLIALEDWVEAARVFESLAQMYGVDEAVSGWEKRKINDTLFGTAAFSYLTIDHESNYPSPIRRGSYIVNHLLCRDLQFPSSEVQSAVDRIVQSAPDGQSPPERMAYFREHAECAGCHNQFDFYGLALEQIGEFGEIRSEYYTGDPVEISGSAGGFDYENALDFTQQLAEHSAINTCFASQVYSYATANSHVAANFELQNVEAALATKSSKEIVTAMLLTAIGDPR